MHGASQGLHQKPFCKGKRAWLHIWGANRQNPPVNPPYPDGGVAPVPTGKMLSTKEKKTGTGSGAQDHSQQGVVGGKRKESGHGQPNNLRTNCRTIWRSEPLKGGKSARKS